MTKLLLVEDDQTLRESLATQLSKASFAVKTASSLREAREISQEGFDLVLLDWDLGDGEGLDLLREWRTAGIHTPVIFLTARTDVLDKVLGLELGADDYVTKPFEMKELVARIRVRLRQIPKAVPSKLKLGDIELDTDKREVRFRGQVVELKNMELELLKYFMENPDRALGRDEILDKVWGLENFPSSRTVDTHVVVLRKKLAAHLFETLHGFGYRFKVGA